MLEEIFSTTEEEYYVSYCFKTIQDLYYSHTQQKSCDSDASIDIPDEATSESDSDDNVVVNRRDKNVHALSSYKVFKNSGRYDNIFLGVTVHTVRYKAVRSYEVKCIAAVQCGGPYRGER
ncbi:hypothetical protein C0J52_26355 [Blattella germanica]|nr:hypothetical protein C0J52_26355 [Blattella germanica]